MSNNAGGTATNSGINFQQRVAAYFVLSMGLNNDISVLFECRFTKNLNRVAFETDNFIDDIVLTHDSHTTYVQVKRKVSLSEKEESPFYKTIRQFVLQDNRNPADNHNYAMITSDDSSKKILRELKKITESARLDQSGFMDNSWTKSEQETYKSFIDCINNICDCNDINRYEGKPLISFI